MPPFPCLWQHDSIVSRLMLKTLLPRFSGVTYILVNWEPNKIKVLITCCPQEISSTTQLAEYISQLLVLPVMPWPAPNFIQSCDGAGAK